MIPMKVYFFTINSLSQCRNFKKVREILKFPRCPLKISFVIYYIILNPKQNYINYGCEYLY